MTPEFTRDQLHEQKVATLIFLTVVSLHLVIWVLLPALLHTGYKPDVIEQLFIGREWVAASARHPAIPALLLEGLNLMTGRAFCSPFLASQICAVLTVWTVWKLGLTVLRPYLALVPSLSMLLYWFFTIESTKYNQNLPYIAFWTAAIYFVHESIRTGKLRFWVLSGIALGLALDSKFSAIILVFSILLFFAVDGKARKTWRGIGPYVTTLAAILAFLPLIIHMIHFQRIPVPAYIADTSDNRRWVQFMSTNGFILNQLAFIATPLLAVGAILKHPMRKRTDLTEEQRWSARFIGVMTFLPFTIHVVLGCTFLDGISADYGAPLWSLLGIWILLLFQTAVPQNALEGSRSGDSTTIAKRFAYMFLGLEAAFIIAFLLQATISTYWLKEPRRFQFPLAELATQCEKIWAANAGGSCPYTTGDWWIAGNAAEGMNPKPSVHAIGAYRNMDGDDPITCWSTDADVNRKGGLVLWTTDSYANGLPKTLFTHFPKAKLLPTLNIHYPAARQIPPLKIGVAIVLPKKPNR